MAVIVPVTNESTVEDVYNSVVSYGYFRTTDTSNRMITRCFASIEANTMIAFQLSESLAVSLGANAGGNIYYLLAASNPFSYWFVVLNQSTNQGTFHSNVSSTLTIVKEFYGLIDRNYQADLSYIEYNGIYENQVIYSDINILYTALIENGIRPINRSYPITYRVVNADVSDDPVEAVVGSSVIVTPVFPDNYGIVNPTSDIYVTCNGVVIPSEYANGVLTFTMPDPS